MSNDHLGNIDEILERDDSSAAFTQWSKGQGYLHMGSSTEHALKWFRRAAEHGNSHAQFMLGSAYETGWGGASDFEEAVKWYRLAAKQGHHVAQLQLGAAYDLGWGLGFVSEAESQEWHRLAVDPSRSGERSYALGEMEYDVGRGCYLAGNSDEAVKWYRRAAEQGLDIAQYALAMAYDDGDGIEANSKDALKWYVRAAEQEFSDAYYWLACAYREIGEYDQAIKWYLRDAEEGNAQSWAELGRMYENGTGVFRDGAKAEELYRRTAEKNRKLGCCSLGNLYVKGEVVPQDFSKAYAWFNLALAVEARDDLMTRMTADQIAEGQRLSRSFEFEIQNKQPSDCDIKRSIPDLSVSEEKQGVTANSQYIFLDFEQGTAEWLDWRNGGIGASDAPTIMGENPWQNSTTLMAEKLGKAKPFLGNAATRRGTELEPEARRQYEEMQSVKVEPICLQSTQYPWMRASLDGISSDHQLVVEIKCGESVYKKTASTRKVPQYYMGQLHHILAVTGLPSIDFYCYLPDRAPICINVPRDDEYIARLISKEKVFWEQVLENLC